MRKWSSVDRKRDVVGLYILCWGGSWLVLLFFWLLTRGDILTDLEVVNYSATLMLLVEGFWSAMLLGLLFAGFYLSLMRVLAKLWRANRLKTILCAITATLLLGWLQLLLIKPLMGGDTALIASPFAVADMVAGIVTLRFLPKLI